MPELLTSENWLRPSPKLLHMRLTEVFAAGVVLELAIALPIGLDGSPLGGVIAALCVAVAAAIGATLMARRCRSWGYCERAADLMVRRGVLFQRLTVVPYGRMQLVDVTAGAVERAFSLQTVRLHTAAAATDARIPGLDHAEAARLRDQLANLGEAQAAGI